MYRGTCRVVYFLSCSLHLPCIDISVPTPDSPVTHIPPFFLTLLCSVVLRTPPAEKKKKKNLKLVVAPAPPCLPAAKKNLVAQNTFQPVQTRQTGVLNAHRLPIFPPPWIFSTESEPPFSCLLHRSFFFFTSTIVLLNLPTSTPNLYRASRRADLLVPPSLPAPSDSPPLVIPRGVLRFRPTRGESSD